MTYISIWDNVSTNPIDCNYVHRDISVGYAYVHMTMHLCFRYHYPNQDLFLHDD